jgi:hypothetical protein
MTWRRAGATAGLLLVALVGLAAPVGVGVLGGHLVGGDPLGLLVCMLVGAVVGLWWSRFVLAVLWWVNTGQWRWRGTSLRASIRQARYGRPL